MKKWQALGWCIIFCQFICLEAQEISEYEFSGTHFIAEYLDCDEEVLNNPEKIVSIMIQAVQASKATFLGHLYYIFPGNGLTCIIMLSESHASIHTYPEKRSCFIDLFTCGTLCSYIDFDRVLREFLKPGSVNDNVLLRNEQINYIPR